MLEALSDVTDLSGLIWLTCGVVVAGFVRGFAGFGSGMIIMPIAASVLPPVAAVTFMMMAELLGPLPNLPAAWRDGTPRDVGRLMLGALVMLPMGIWFLSHMDATVFGWIVSFVVAVLLAVLVSGWRYAGVLTPKLTIATGGFGGFMAGFAGMPGPPVIMLYMSSKQAISVIRANVLLYLFAADVVMIAVFYALDLFVWKVALLGLLAGIPNVIANIIGARLFDPTAEVLFRRVAYCIIAASAILGLPLWN
ncbi:sulfite exporter TauE/SafE family protein [Roseobacter sp.]|uniref:sulfite exporter TauE/SafE family protein n=1 Tax=Roseobacter sp. TaxID=1907202 RepID=UPI0032985B4D